METWKDAEYHYVLLIQTSMHYLLGSCRCGCGECDESMAVVALSGDFKLRRPYRACGTPRPTPAHFRLVLTDLLHRSMSSACHFVRVAVANVDKYNWILLFQIHFSRAQRVTGSSQSVRCSIFASALCLCSRWYDIISFKGC